MKVVVAVTIELRVTLPLWYFLLESSVPFCEVGVTETHTVQMRKLRPRQGGPL